MRRGQWGLKMGVLLRAVVSTRGNDVQSSTRCCPFTIRCFMLKKVGAWLRQNCPIWEDTKNWTT